jgi:hypothetical protein
VIYRQHLPDSAPISSTLRTQGLCVRFISPKSLPHNLFADPHPLTPIASIFYKKGGGGRGTPRFRSLVTPRLSLSLLSATLMGRLVSVANTELVGMLSPLDATLTKNWGWGGGGAMFNQESDKDSCPEEHRDEGSIHIPNRFLSRATIGSRGTSPLGPLPLHRTANVMETFSQSARPTR